MSKPHTPGPWFCTTQDDEMTGSVSTRPLGGSSIAQTWGDDAHGNARLISAAPELLAELRAAHLIIKNAAAVMPLEVLEKWHRLNLATGAAVEDPARAPEREAAFDMAQRGNWPR